MKSCSLLLVCRRSAWAIDKRLLAHWMLDRSSDQTTAVTTTATLSATTPAAAAPSTKAEDGGNDETPKEWTEEEDLLLQEMLKQHPASMDKNERWKLIAKGVQGRTKKECVQRFKDIREAVRKGKN